MPATTAREFDPIRHLTKVERAALRIPTREPDVKNLDGSSVWEADDEQEVIPDELPGARPELTWQSGHTQAAHLALVTFAAGLRFIGRVVKCRSPPSTKA